MLHVAAGWSWNNKPSPHPLSFWIQFMPQVFEGENLIKKYADDS
jgi:hypothetical protein